MLDVGEITKLLNASYSSLESYLYKHSTVNSLQSIDSLLGNSLLIAGTCTLLSDIQCMAVAAPNGC